MLKLSMDIQDLSTKSYDRALAQKNLEEKQLGRMLLAHANGIWICDPNLISLLMSYKNYNEIILLDANKIPRKVSPTELLELVQTRHQEVLNDWFIEYNNLIKIRTIKHVLE
jgi:hypothetical protein